MNQTLQGAHSGALSSRNRQHLGTRFCLSLALLLTLSLTSFKLTASAQVCFDQCQQAYVQCLHSEGYPLLCDDQYDLCLEACM